MIIKLTASEQDQAKLRDLVVDPIQIEDDGTDYAGVVIRKPWGREYLAFQNPQVAVWILHITSDNQTSLHCHLNKKTSLIVLSGQVVVTTLIDKFELRAGQGLLIGEKVFHSTRAVSPEGAVVMETETPTNKRDLIRLDDRYGRQREGYEGREHYLSMPEIPRPDFLDIDARYNLAKQIGESQMMMVRLRTPEEFWKFSEEFEPNLVGLLDGSMNVKGQSLIGPGDVLPRQNMMEFEILGEAEILFIKTKK